MRDASQSEANDLTGDNNAEAFVLHLYVTGASSNSLRAIANIKAICEKYIHGNYTLEVIDIHQDEALAASEQIIALPMLIKRTPFPERRMIGDMSNTQKVLRGLGIAAF